MSKHKKQKRELDSSEGESPLAMGMETAAPEPSPEPALSVTEPPVDEPTILRANFAVGGAVQSPQVEVVPRVSIPRASIGGKLYSFRKGVAQYVPAEVQQRLRECDAL